jgi:hypothetical protein
MEAIIQRVKAAIEQGCKSIDNLYHYDDDLYHDITGLSLNEYFQIEELFPQ